VVTKVRQHSEGGWLNDLVGNKSLVDKTQVEGVVEQWRSLCNGERHSARTRTPHKSVVWSSLRRWVLPMQGMENPPSATCWYGSYRQRRTRETRGKPSVQKRNTCQVSKRTACQMVKFWQLWIKIHNQKSRTLKSFPSFPITTKVL
jgi:hypothetical protein